MTSVLAATVYLPDRSVRAPGRIEARTASRCQLHRREPSLPARVSDERCQAGLQAAARERDGGNAPSDLAKTTTTAGATVNFIVRVETGTMNRGHLPERDPARSDLGSRADAVCGSERHGTADCSALHGIRLPRRAGTYDRAMGAGGVHRAVARLGRGLRRSSSTRSITPPTAATPSSRARQPMMGKEALHRRLRRRRSTRSPWAGSGGAYTSLQIADALSRPLRRRRSSRATFPDALAHRASGLDAHSADALLRDRRSARL